MRIFQCRGCGTLVFGKPEAPEPSWCPLCRLGLVEVHRPDPPPPVRWWTCPECGETFGMLQQETPYKCAYCNYTFPSTEHRWFPEKL